MMLILFDNVARKDSKGKEKDAKKAFVSL